MDFQERTFKPSPRESAGFLSKIFFTWTLSIFRKGRKTKLGIDDLYRLIPADSSEKLGIEFMAKWDASLLKAKADGKRPSLLKTLCEIHIRWYLLLVIPILIDSGIMGVLLPICVRLFIKSFKESENISSYERYLYAAGILITAFYRTLVIQICNFKFFHIAMRIRVALSMAVYRKVLRLTRSGQDAASIGHVINLFSNDLNRFDMVLIQSPFFAAGPLVLLTCGYVLWREIGVAAFAGIGVVLIIAPIQYFAGSYSAVLRLKLATRTDKRAKLMSELIGAMRVIKMYAWEKPFSVLIHKLRRHEMTAATNRLFVRALFNIIFNLSHRVVMFVTLVTYYWTGHPLTAEKVFFASSIYIKIVHSIILNLPSSFANLGETFVAARRIENFLLLEDDIEQVSQNLTVFNPEKLEKSNQEMSIVMENVWAGAEKQTLANLNFSVAGNKLIMIVGEVGSGKTSMLNVLIGELAIQSGSCTINGQACYASQEPWIFSGTIRQNIIFGKPYDEKSYSAIIEACALNHDLSNWENGDMTRVGERGVTLSGGQKARISLARALYTNSNICLLDDILSAVDAKVSRHLFEKCIMGALRDNLRVVVTHQLQYLPFADHIIVLKDGCVQAQGTFAELQKENIELINLLNAKGRHSKDQDLNNKDNESENEILENGSSSSEKSISESDGKEKDEEMKTGKVTFRTYWKYFRTGDSSLLMVIIAVGFIALSSVSSFNDYWLSHWTNTMERQSHIDTEFKNITETGNANHNNDSSIQFENSTYISVYTGTVAGSTIGFLIVTLLFFRFGLNIGVNMHDRMFRSLVRAPIEFFDKNPSGRIMNRFTHDIGALDEFLVMTMYDTILILLQCIFVFMLICILNPVLILPTILIIGALCMMRQYYIPTSRALKRIDAITKSPCLTHLTATYQGLTTVRALRAQGVLIKQFCAQLDVNSCCWYQLFSTGRWFSIWLDLIVVIYLAVVIISFCIFSTADGISGTVGLAVTSALMMLSAFQWAIRQSTATESHMTSVERLLEYVGIPPEASLESKPECKPPSDWPSSGHIRFDSVSLAYGGTKVLDNVSFEVKPRQKIGVIGRTGAGKSSLVAALFRMVEPDGNIYIDGVRVQDIGLHDLRQRISIIPQDPQLFSGTVRYNLDPFEKYEDSELWQAIEDVELKDAIPALDFLVSSGGSNFSVGQRQLMCLARAILRKNCILVSDEATANVDERTDALIQTTIRDKFAFCTIITIAHRLNTVMDCDKILVLENGTIMEFAEPTKLLQNPNSYLSLMIGQTGKLLK